MTIKSDRWIRQQIVEHGMITPAELSLVRRVNDKPVISFGVSSYGYDMRIDDVFHIFTPTGTASVVDPKNPNPALMIEHRGPYVDIPPGSYVLANSLERFCIPKRVLVLVVGKSTYARAGINVNVTPGEPGWVGHWTIEIANATPLPARVYAHEGIAQCLFFESDEDCEVSYEDRGGKYMNQGRVPVMGRV